MKKKFNFLFLIIVNDMFVCNDYWYCFVVIKSKVKENPVPVELLLATSFMVLYSICSDIVCGFIITF